MAIGQQQTQENGLHGNEDVSQPLYFRYKGLKVKFDDIEKALIQSGKVKEAVVLSEEDMEGGKKLVAYVVPNSSFDQSVVEQYLADTVPPYMVPQLWMSLKSLPLTSN